MRHGLHRRHGAKKRARNCQNQARVKNRGLIRAGHAPKRERVALKERGEKERGEGERGEKEGGEGERGQFATTS